MGFFLLKKVSKVGVVVVVVVVCTYYANIFEAEAGKFQVQVSFLFFVLDKGQGFPLVLGHLLSFESVIQSRKEKREGEGR